MKNRRISLAVCIFAGLLVVQGSGTRLAQALTEDDYRQLETFANVLSVAQQNSVPAVSTKELLDGAIKGMLSSLDPHSAYLTGERYRDLEVHTRGIFGGIGITVMIKNGVLTVNAPMKDTPAERVGIKAGDQIIKINNDSTDDMTLDAAVTRMRGPRGSSIRLTLRRDGIREPFTLSVAREVIKIQSVESNRIDGYAYIRLSGFQEASDKEIEKRIDDFRRQGHGSIPGLVFDLRDNPGGLLSQAVSVSDEFLNGGLVVYTQGRDERERQKYFAQPKSSFYPYPMVVLVNGGTASASEIVAGALQDQGRALIVGTQTFGKGSVQTILPIDDHSALQLTTARYYTPGGRSIQAVGITPDLEVNSHPVRPTTKGPEWVKDVQLAKSIEVLKHWNSFKTQLVKKDSVIG
jgi:carboxyl-terminal processing protease